MSPLCHTAPTITVAATGPFVLGAWCTRLTIGVATCRTVIGQPTVRTRTTQHPTEVTNSITTVAAFRPSAYTVVGSQRPTNA